MRVFTKKNLTVGAVALVAPLVMSTAPALAASSFGNHLWKFASGPAVQQISFNQGGSNIYDNGQLHIATDDYLYLNAPVLTVIQKDAQVVGTLRAHALEGPLAGNVTGNLTGNVTGGTITADSVTLGNNSPSALSGTVTVDNTRATGATGSYQSLAGDLTLNGAAGSSTSNNPKFQAGVMGNLHGGTLTATSNYNAGVIGAYSVLATDATTYPAAGVIGDIGMDGATSGADGAFVAVIDGDGGVVTANAAYGVDYLNSTGGSHFSYGLDLFHGAHDGFAAVTYGTADIRLASGATISSGSSNPSTCVKGSINLNITDGKLYTCSATDTWVVTGSQS